MQYDSKDMVKIETPGNGQGKATKGKVPRIKCVVKIDVPPAARQNIKMEQVLSVKGHITEIVVDRIWVTDGPWALRFGVRLKDD